jgi:hypothetical protein
MENAAEIAAEFLLFDVRILAGDVPRTELFLKKFVQLLGQNRSQKRSGDCSRISRSKSSMLAACGSSKRRQITSVTANITATTTKKRLNRFNSKPRQCQFSE